MRPLCERRLDKMICSERLTTDPQGLMWLASMGVLDRCVYNIHVGVGETGVVSIATPHWFRAH